MSDTPPEAIVPEPEPIPPAIVRVPATVDPAVDASNPAGHPHGAIVKSLTGEYEKIVHLVDEVTGAFLGWHKEPVNEDGSPRETGHAPAVVVSPVADPDEVPATADPDTVPDEMKPPAPIDVEAETAQVTDQSLAEFLGVSDDPARSPEPTVPPEVSPAVAETPEPPTTPPAVGP